MHFDGSKLLGGLGAGVVLTSPKGDKLQYVLQMHFRASNNVAEYEALAHGLKMAKQIGIKRILCFGDSDLVTHQVSGDWDARDANMVSYRFYVQQLSGIFEGCEFHHVPRANNDEADRLSKIGSTRQDIPAGVSLEIIRKPSIKLSPESPSIFRARRSHPGSGAATGPGGCRLSAEGSSWPAQRGRLGERHGDCRLHARSPNRTIR
jgi:ribonuclease HI